MKNMTSIKNQKNLHTLLDKPPISTDYCTYECVFKMY